MSDGDATRAPVFGGWGPAVRVRIDHAAVWTFAKAVRDRSPVYASERAALEAGFTSVPAPPTFTFAMMHSGAFPDLQPPSGTGRMMPPTSLPGDGVAPEGLYLHGEQHFVYHRQPCVGDVLEGRMRVSGPMPKRGSRGRMEITVLETRWSDPSGEPVVTEQIVSVFLPDG